MEWGGGGRVINGGSLPVVDDAWWLVEGEGWLLS